MSHDGEIQASSIRVVRLDQQGGPGGEPITLDRQVAGFPLHAASHVDADAVDAIVFAWGGYVASFEVETERGFDHQTESVRRLMADRAEEQAVVVRAAVRDAGRAVVGDASEMRRLTREAIDPFGLDGWA